MLIPIKTGMQTLIWASKKPNKPTDHGNCFDLIDPNGEAHRVVNFYIENFNDITKQLNLTNINVDFVDKSDHLYKINDARIPKEWYSKEYCTRCTPIRMLPIEQRKKYLKGKTFKKCGGEYPMLIISQKHNPIKKPSIAFANYTVQPKQDITAFSITETI